MPKSDQGVLPDRYQVIPRTLIFVFRGEQVLLIKGAPTKRLWAGKYNGIGGHVERGEDIHTAAARELTEEAGLSTASLFLCGTILVDASDQTGILIFVFRGDYDLSTIIDPIPSVEGELDWVPFTGIGVLPLVEDLQVILPRVIQWKPGVAPFSARSFYDADEQLRLIFG